MHGRPSTASSDFCDQVHSISLANNGLSSAQALQTLNHYLPGLRNVSPIRPALLPPRRPVRPALSGPSTSPPQRQGSKAPRQPGALQAGGGHGADASG